MSGGLLYEANDLAGIIPYADLGQMPQTNQDKITYLNETYRITQTKILNVGNGHVGVAIVAKK